jgi:L-ascorbate metabolism protein UlaG (beta-lactamase superfamily)
MQLSKFGHSCVLVTSGAARLLIDPGSFSHGFESLTGLTGVLITHQHGDHLDTNRLHELLGRNPDAQVVCDRGSVELLRERGIEPKVVEQGDRFELGVPVRVFGELHAVIHPDLPQVPNVGYLVDERFFHPGDSFTVPDVDVEVLGVPAGAPWLRIADSIDYVRRIRPRIALPIHECVLAYPEMAYDALRRLGPEGTTLRPLAVGERTDV